MKVGLRLSVVSLVLMLLSVGCGAPPTVESPPGSTAAVDSSEPAPASGAPQADPMEAVYAAVDGLTGEERQARLIELADEEGGEVTVYTSTNLDESQPLIEAFEDATGIDVSLYRASASTVLQRTFQEAEADFEGGADVLAINGPEMTILDAEGLLAPLQTPATEAILPGGVFETWSAMYLNVFVAGWNTDRVDQASAPTTYQELFTNFEGQLGMELGDWDWFATLTKYFMAEQGMTEDEAVELFKNAARGARVVDGHTLMTELLAAGEFDVTASNYQHRVLRLINEDAPIAWEPPIEPMVVRPNGIGISARASSPAAALLYLEFVLTDGQDLFAGLERTPASTEALGGLDSAYEVLFADVEALLEERDKWEALYEEVVQESGQIIEE